MTINEVIFTLLQVEHNPYLKNLTFEQLVEQLQPRIEAHVRKHSGKIPGYDDDDIKQELLIELWKKVDRIPAEINQLDYRFTRYVETIFNRRIIDIHRNMLVSRRPGEYRDGIHRSAFIGEEIEFFDRPTLTSTKQEREYSYFFVNGDEC